MTIITIHLETERYEQIVEALNATGLGLHRNIVADLEAQAAESRKQEARDVAGKTVRVYGHDRELLAEVTDVHDWEQEATPTGNTLVLMDRTEEDVAIFTSYSHMIVQPQQEASDDPDRS